MAKFLSIDPLSPDYPWYTPYQFAGNKPIWAIDLDGLEELIYQESAKDYQQGINAVVAADKYLTEQYASMTSPERSHMKIYIAAESFMDESHPGAYGTASNLTQYIHYYKKMSNWLDKTNKDITELDESKQNSFNKAKEYPSSCERI